MGCSLCKFKTIHQGEQALIRDFEGEARAVDGPARLFLWRSKTQMLERYYAGEGQYLEVNYHQEPKKCLVGPVSVFFNPIVHKSIITHESLFVNSNEALIVYQVHSDGEKNALIDNLASKEVKQDVERKIIYGPKRYVLQPDEWIHQFKWHGTDSTNKGRKIPGATNFQLLRIIADKLYYNVTDVRTKDDTLVKVKLMIFFELENIEKMLDNTHDPIADFINAAASDTVAFCAVLTYEEFLERTSQMNELSTFKQLQTRAHNIGYKILKVVFRGFHSTDALQQMHDQAIQERTKLRLQADTELQRQRHLDLQLAKEEERSIRQRELEKRQDEHRREMDKINHAQVMEQERQKEDANIETKKKILELEKLTNQQELDKLEKMKEMGVDLTKVLVAECRNPDKSYRIEGGVKDLKFHMHQNDTVDSNTNV